jgi:probable HAF family extracellular repeat protein
MKHASSILGILTLAIGSALVVLPASAVTYSVTDLGALPNGCALGGSANDAGQVIGMLTNGHAFVYTPGIGAVDIGTLRGDAMALAINNAGQVAGHANVNGVERAFLYTPGVGMADIGP